MIIKKSYCLTEWQTPNNPPTFDNHMGGVPFTNILIKNKNGNIGQAVYEDENFWMFGSVLKLEDIEGWCYFPDKVSASEQDYLTAYASIIIYSDNTSDIPAQVEIVEWNGKMILLDEFKEIIDDDIYIITSSSDQDLPTNDLINVKLEFVDIDIDDFHNECSLEKVTLIKS